MNLADVRSLKRKDRIGNRFAMRVFSLFSGIGGFDLACKNKGHEIIGACEIDKYARQVYARHFPNVRIYSDATKINPSELPDFDIICGGFPCQAFSFVGKRKGFDDIRGTLFFEIARIAKEKRPKLLLLENVKGLLNHDNGRTFETIIRTLDELGYDVEWQLLNGKYWLPQRRERLYIVGHLREKPTPKIFPIGEGSEIVCGSSSPTHDEREWFQTACVNTIVSNYYKGWAGSRTMIDTNGKRRYLTPLECERLQGFPDDWTNGLANTRRYIGCGNAVMVPLIETLVRRLQ